MTLSQSKKTKPIKPNFRKALVGQFSYRLMRSEISVIMSLRNGRMDDADGQYKGF
jgi:hypothetical protein